ncbi:MAG: hypothetical protein AB7U85_01880 [Alphaproteobacteria bacterium]
MNTSKDVLEWKGDVVKDTITYRYIETAANALDLAIAENPTLLTTYQNWLTEVKDSASLGSIIFSEFSPEKDTKITIFSLTKANEFLTKFEAPEFNLLLSFSYDFEKRDIVAARVTQFKGNYNMALSWVESILARMEEAFEKVENNS